MRPRREAQERQCVTEYVMKSLVYRRMMYRTRKNDDVMPLQGNDTSNLSNSQPSHVIVAPITRGVNPGGFGR